MLGVNTQFSKYALRLSRRDVGILIGLLTGHNTLNRHLVLLKRKSDVHVLYVRTNKKPVYISVEDVALQ